MYETANHSARATELPFHVRARAVSESMLTYLEHDDPNDPDIEALAAFGVLYGAMVADKSLRFQMSRYNAELETRRSNEALSARLAALDSSKGNGNG